MDVPAAPDGPTDPALPAESERTARSESERTAESKPTAERDLPRLPGFREMALRRMAGERRRLVSELTAHRQAAGLSQTQVAARMGTSQSAVARIEAGEADVRASTLERYAAAIGSQLSWRLAEARPADEPQLPSGAPATPQIGLAAPPRGPGPPLGPPGPPPAHPAAPAGPSAPTGPSIPAGPAAVPAGPWRLDPAASAQPPGAPPLGARPPGQETAAPELLHDRLADRSSQEPRQ